MFPTNLSALWYSSCRAFTSTTTSDAWNALKIRKKHWKKKIRKPFFFFLLGLPDRRQTTFWKPAWMFWTMWEELLQCCHSMFEWSPCLHFISTVTQPDLSMKSRLGSTVCVFVYVCVYVWLSLASSYRKNYSEREKNKIKWSSWTD